MMGGVKSFLKKMQQVCDGQNYYLFVDDEYLVSDYYSNEFFYNLTAWFCLLQLRCTPLSYF